MKPRYRPGKAATGGRASRSEIAASKPLSPSQLEHLKPNHEMHTGKAGRGGKRAKWKLTYEEGFQYEGKPMPGRTDEDLSEDGIRKLPKRGH